MKLAHATKKVLAASLLAGSAVFTGLGLGVAHADTSQPHHWCPGDPKHMPYAPATLDWDWNICHTWYVTNPGMGNVTSQGRPDGIWDGDNPPIEAITMRQCPPISFMCP